MNQKAPHRRPRRAAVSVAALAAALIVAGCSAEVSVGGSGVGSEELAEQVSSQLEASADDVECDGNLGDEVGDTQTCHLSDGGGQLLQIDVETTSVDGDTVSFSIEVEPHLTAEEVSAAISDNLAERVGARPESITCTAALGSGDGDAASEITCELRDGPTRRDIAVEATSGPGEPIDFSFDFVD